MHLPSRLFPVCRPYVSELAFRANFPVDIGVPQDKATPMYEDNNGALMMANAGQPTKRTRHIDIRHFALLDWVERDLVVLERIDTTANPSDALTKATGRILFHRHYDYFMGREVPWYVGQATARHTYGWESYFITYSQLDVN